MSVFAERLENSRKKFGVSQKKFSELIDISQAYYNRFEKGTGQPNIETMVKISNTLNISVDYLLGLTDITEINMQSSNSEIDGIVQRNITNVDNLEIEVIVRRKKPPTPRQEN